MNPKDMEETSGKCLATRLAVFGAAVHAILGLAIYIVLVFVVPGYEKMFHDMGVALPVPTMFVLSAARLMSSLGFASLLLGAVAAVCDGAICVALMRSEGTRAATIWVAAVTGILILFGLLIPFAIWLPLQKMQQVL